MGVQVKLHGEALAHTHCLGSMEHHDCPLREAANHACPVGSPRLPRPPRQSRGVAPASPGAR